MATFRFKVARKGVEPVWCTAEVPPQNEILAFKGGKVKVSTPKGERTVELSPGLDMLLGTMTIELQTGVRDFLFPKDDEKPSGKRSSSGYQD